MPKYHRKRSRSRSKSPHKRRNSYNDKKGHSPYRRRHATNGSSPDIQYLRSVNANDRRNSYEKPEEGRHSRKQHSSDYLNSICIFLLLLLIRQFVELYSIILSKPSSKFAILPIPEGFDIPIET
jgi:hypothetical protein